jgi:ribosomal protein S1
MKDVNELIRAGQVALGTVKSFSDAGAIVMLPQGLNGHIPKTEISWLQKLARPEEFFKKGQEVRVQVTKAKRSANGNIIVELSCRALEENPWPRLHAIHPIGSQLPARVVDFLPFGATVQFSSGFRALLHNSELTWQTPIPASGDRHRPKLQAADYLRLGETISVVVQKFDIDKRKIWVSHKLTQPNPWESVKRDYPIKSRITGYVVNIAKYGCFVQLPNGCVGLLHENSAPERALDEYGLGDEVRVVIGDIDDELRRISLTLDVTSFDTNDTSTTFLEGRRRVAVVNYYERNPKARRACLNHYGASCVVCGMDFAERYGEVADGYIHVHHLNPIASIGEVYQLDPIRDLRPVCPNCHAVIHLRTPPYGIEELAALIANRQ